MKISCQSCQAKYTIADEKVLGKVVKIRCKKCGATIVVNGSDTSASASTTTESDPHDAPVASVKGEPSRDAWTVNVGDGDQRTMTDNEIVAAFKSGVVDGDTYIWKDGLEDWAPLREVAPLYAQCTEGVAAPASSPDPISRVGAPRAGGIATGNGTGNVPLSAARRGGGRAPAADLFGAVAQAGGEEDVLTSAPAKMPQPHTDPQKGPIGARNENSVLFSMSAVTGKNPSERPPQPVNAGGTTEASGLIDIRALSAQLRVEDKKRSRVDDIMNLSGGSGFLPHLAAPSLSSPAAEEYGGPGGSQSPGGIRNKGLVFLALGAGAFLIVAAVGLATVLMHGKSGEIASDKSVASTGDSALAAVPSSVPGTASPTVSATQATATTSASAAASAMAPAASATENTAEPPKTEAPKETKAASAPVAAAHEAAPKAAPVEVADQPFNMGEAKARLGAAASGAAACKRAGGPTGTGRIVVVFAPTGGTQSATISGEPFEGTPTGSCVVSRFRAVRVPAFSGSPFSVSKSFTIN